jgi:hypothetical protein
MLNDALLGVIDMQRDAGLLLENILYIIIERTFGAVRVPAPKSDIY